MTTPPDVPSVPSLPFDVWVHIAQKIPFPERARVAETNRMVAQAVRDTWHEGHYFQCAGQPDKAPKLRIPHRLPEPDEKRPWRALTRELKHFRQTSSAREELVQRKPRAALVALARHRQPNSTWFESDVWPIYESALRSAYRNGEADGFAELTAQLSSLKAALETGDQHAVANLLAAGMPLPRFSYLLIKALNAQPTLAALIVRGLVKEAQYDLLGEVFAQSNEESRKAVLATAHFDEDAKFRSALHHAASKGRNPGALRLLLQRCSTQQYKRLICPVALDRVGVAFLRNLHMGNFTGDAFVQVHLPRWVEVGGDPTEALASVPYLSPQSVDLLVELKGCPQAALRKAVLRDITMTDSDRMDSIVQALLRHGAHLTLEEFSRFVEYNMGADGQAASAAALKVARRFRAEGALPPVTQKASKDGVQQGSFPFVEPPQY